MDDTDNTVMTLDDGDTASNGEQNEACGVWNRNSNGV